MAAIDQVIAKGGDVAPSGGAPAAAPTAGVALGVALAVGLNTWPWSHICGLRLYYYLAAIGLLGLTGMWVMLVSWRRRSGLSHILGLLMLAYAVWLGASELLPRVGYAKSDATWGCPAQ